MSLLGNIVRQNKKEPAATAGLIDANDGLSLDLTGTIAQLGQSVGAVGDPAALLDDREIPFDGFDFAFGEIGDRKLFFDLANDRYRFGDVDNATMGMTLDINAANDSIQVRSPLVQFLIGSPDTAAGLNPSASFGAIALAESTAWLMGINTGSGVGFASLENSAGSRVIDTSMTAGGGSNFINIGGVGGSDNGNGLFINDNIGTVQARISERSGFVNQNFTDWYLDIDPAGFFGLGDVNSAGNGTQLFIDDTSETVELLSGGNQYFLIDAANKTAYLAAGDIPAFLTSAAEIALNPSDSGNVVLNTQDVTGTKTATLYVIPANESVEIDAANGFSTNGINYWLFGAASAGGPTVDSKIRVTIGGVNYDIAAEAV